MALPSLPSFGQNPWYVPRTNWDNAVESEIETLPEKFVATVSPAGYGAVGDNSADDTVALQAAINAGATLGLRVDLRGLTYRTTDQVNVPSAAIVANGTIHCTGSAKKILNVTGNNTQFLDLEIVGRHSVATASTNEFGIYATGASAPDPILGITLRNVGVRNVGMYGVQLRYVTGFSIKDCHFWDLGYAGVSTLSAIQGEIKNNRIHDILAGFSGNGYGIALSRNEVTSLVTDPRSSHIEVTGNYVANVPWEGIDTHGGSNLIISSNSVLHCTVGIAIVGADGAGNVTLYGAQNVEVSRNIIDSQVTNGSLGIGISIAGAPGGDISSSAEAATGIVSNNIVKGHGTENNSGSGAIRLRDTSGYTVMNNLLIEPSPSGIVVANTNFALTVTDNTIIDHWSNSVSLASAIYVQSQYNAGIVSGNMHRNAGNKAAATYKNERGYNVATATNTDLQVTNNWFRDCTIPYAGTTTSKNRPGVQTLFGGTFGEPGAAFGTDTTSGFYPIGASDFGLAVGGARKWRYTAAATFVEDGHNIAFGTTNGTRLGTATTHKLGFWGATPVVRPAAIANATDAATAISQLNLLLAAARTVGLIAP